MQSLAVRIQASEGSEGVSDTAGWRRRKEVKGEGRAIARIWLSERLVAYKPLVPIGVIPNARGRCFALKEI